MPRKYATEKEVEEAVERILNAVEFSRGRQIRNTTNATPVKVTFTPDELAAFSPFYVSDSGPSLFSSRSDVIREFSGAGVKAFSHLLGKGGTLHTRMLTIEHKLQQEEHRRETVHKLYNYLDEIERRLRKATDRVETTLQLDILLEYIRGEVFDEYPEMKARAEKMYADNGGGWIK